MADDEVDTLPVYEPADPQVQTALSELDENLVERRFTGTSGDRVVTATVDGRTALLDLAIEDSALRRGHLDAVGRSIVEAVTEARAKATRLSGEFLAETLDPSLPNPDLTIPSEPVGQPAAFTPAPAAQVVEDQRIGVVEDEFVSEPPRPARRSRPAPAEEEEEFDPFQGHRDDGGSW